MSRGAFAPQLTSLALMSGRCSCRLGLFLFPFLFLSHLCIVRALPFNCAVISDSLLVFLDFVWLLYSSGFKIPSLYSSWFVTVMISRSLTENNLKSDIRNYCQADRKAVEILMCFLFIFLLWLVSERSLYSKSKTCKTNKQNLSVLLSAAFCWLGAGKCQHLVGFFG